MSVAAEELTFGRLHPPVVTPESVVQLKSELMSRNEGVITTHERVDSSLYFIDAIKKAREKRRDEGIEDARHEVMADLLTDGVEYFGNTSLFVMEGRGTKGWHNEKSKPYLINAITARNNLLETIDRYVTLFDDATEDSAYEAFLAVMNDTKAVVSGINDLGFHQRADAENHIRGILAEHKVFSAIKEMGIQGVAYSSPELDLNGSIDIVVPVEGYENQLGIQVKGHRRNGKLTVTRRKATGIIWVTVPMNESQNPFSLSPADKRRLSSRLIKYAFPVVDPESSEEAA
jgi:hypothetical protein